MLNRKKYSRWEEYTWYFISAEEAEEPFNAKMFPMQNGFGATVKAWRRFKILKFWQKKTAQWSGIWKAPQFLYTPWCKTCYWCPKGVYFNECHLLWIHFLPTYFSFQKANARLQTWSIRDWLRIQAYQRGNDLVASVLN